MVQIESKIEFDLTFMENVLCVFDTTYWVLGRHNKYQKWFYRKCYNVIWFFIGWSRAIKCNLPMVFNTSRSKTPDFSPYPMIEFHSLLYDKILIISARTFKNGISIHFKKTQNFSRPLLNEVFRLAYFEQFIISFSGLFSQFIFVFVLTFSMAYA